MPFASRRGEPVTSVKTAGRVVGLASAVRWVVEARKPSPRTERILLALASSAMLIGAFVAWREGAFSSVTFRWWPIVIAAALGVPATAATNAWEYWLSARAAGLALRPMEALRTTILATAANLLPLPGGPLVRIQALRAGGVTGRTSTQVTAAAGASWVAVGSLAAAIGGWAAGAPSGAVIPLAALGSLTAFVAASLLRVAVVGGQRSWGAVGAQLAAIEAVSILVTAARLYLLLLAIGAPAGVGAAIMLALASVLATAVGVVPAGLGVREALSALLALAVGLPGATGFAVSLMDRIVGLTVVAPLTLLLSVTRSSREQRS